MVTCGAKAVPTPLIRLWRAERKHTRQADKKGTVGLLERHTRAPLSGAEAGGIGGQGLRRRVGGLAGWQRHAGEKTDAGHIPRLARPHEVVACGEVDVAYTPPTLGQRPLLPVRLDHGNHGGELSAPQDPDSAEDVLLEVVLAGRRGGGDEGPVRVERSEDAGRANGGSEQGPVMEPKARGSDGA